MLWMELAQLPMCFPLAHQQIATPSTALPTAECKMKVFVRVSIRGLEKSHPCNKMIRCAVPERERGRRGVKRAMALGRINRDTSAQSLPERERQGKQSRVGSNLPRTILHMHTLM